MRFDEMKGWEKGKGNVETIGLVDLIDSSIGGYRKSVGVNVPKIR